MAGEAVTNPAIERICAAIVDRRGEAARVLGMTEREVVAFAMGLASSDEAFQLHIDGHGDAEVLAALCAALRLTMREAFPDGVDG